MATISEKLQLALDNKAKIKAAIEEKGGVVSDFASFADAIRNIQVGGPDSSVKYGKQTLLVDFGNYEELYTNMEFENLFGASTMYVTKLVLPKKTSFLQYYNDLANFISLRDLTIYQDLYYSYTRVLVKDIILGVGTTVTDGNLRLEDWEGDVPEELLNRFIGWELYINGDHIGTIEPKQEEGYYYSEQNKLKLYYGSGYDGTFCIDLDGAMGVALVWKDTNPFYGKQILEIMTEKGRVLVSTCNLDRKNYATIYVDTSFSLSEVEWIEVTLG